MIPQQWQFWIDRGGTFTDVVARDPAGYIHVHKLLSEDPDHYDDAPLHAIRTLLQLDPREAIPADVLGAVKMGTTLATNALLERKGARVGLVITAGFADLLEIGYQDRPDLFALHIQKSETLAARVVEAQERVLADGTVRASLNVEAMRVQLQSLKDDGIESLAVLLLHSYAYPEHERQIGTIAHEMGFSHIALSHRAAREIKAVGRGDTVVVDAYLTPMLRAYTGRLRAALGEEAPLRFMQSNGGLVDANSFSGKDAVLSGPAGGVVACAHVSKLAGHEKVIGFDMGGTSTDVSRYDGDYDRVYEMVVAGVRIKAPMMAINTVAAGGGSILDYDSGRFTVGPESAGAYPGPACYRNDGPATVTDANLVLGRIHPDYFPACFGPDGDALLNRDASEQRLAALGEHIYRDTGNRMSVEEIAAGYIRIANENMAKPIKEISVAKGCDVQDYALVCFGGAGAQHACALCDLLGIRTVLIHPHAGVLSAYGMGLADASVPQVEAVLAPLTDDLLKTLSERIQALEEVGALQLKDQGFTSDRISHIASLDLRYIGVESSITVLMDSFDEIKTQFEERHYELYGFIKKEHPIEAVALRVESLGLTEKPDESYETVEQFDVAQADAVTTATLWNATVGTVQSVPVYEREALRPGACLSGPALIVESVSTIVLDDGWRGSVNGYGHLELTRVAAQQREAVGVVSDPIMLEVFNNLFMSVAMQMGETLERVSHSANIKERLDFSCAVFDAGGDLVANAPHIPVHLGAMSESVRAIIKEREGKMRPGDAYITNDPYHGGSHLPDVTLVAPVFMEGEMTPAFYVASRGHHADIGGITPGSMPPFSTSIEEEGVVIHDFCLVSDGEFHEEAIVDLLTSGPYPARNIPERLSDLRAQLASLNAGEKLLQDLCKQYGPITVQAYMGHVRDNATRSMRERIGRLPDGIHRAEDTLDSGAKIVCTVTVSGDEAVVDFAGTDAQLEGNLNAPQAVVVAAVLYVFRTLMEKSIPLNGGCLEPITIRIPEGSLLAPEYPAAVVGGNVETSNRVVDVLYAALGVVAGSQGTMNNFTFGTKDWGYYETICGGAGAGPDFDGASAVHTHMTNTRITDPEVLERRYPVILREFSIRRGSGGQGKNVGGDGVRRVVEFREPMSVGILSERRTTRPYGLNGGEPGESGRNSLERDGKITELAGHAKVDVKAGDAIIIDTPGGGGYGEKFPQPE